MSGVLALNHAPAAAAFGVIGARADDSSTDRAASLSSDPLFPGAAPPLASVPDRGTTAAASPRAATGTVLLPTVNPIDAAAAAAAAAAASSASSADHSPLALARNLSGEQAVRSISADELDSSLAPGSSGPGFGGPDADDSSNDYARYNRPGTTNNNQGGGGFGRRNPTGGAKGSKKSNHGTAGVSSGRATPQQTNGTGSGHEAMGTSDIIDDSSRGSGHPHAGKPRTGLLKRLRNALRGTAQATRARETKRAGEGQFPGASMAASGFDVVADPHQHGRAPAGAAGVAKTRSNVNASTPRARTFTTRQGFSSSRNLGSKRDSMAAAAIWDHRDQGTANTELSEDGQSLLRRDNVDPATFSHAQPEQQQQQQQQPTSKSRRFLARAGLAASGAIKISSEQQTQFQHQQQPRHGPSASQPLDPVVQQNSSSALHPSQSTGSIHRSLPKTRVFSSPPSFSFGFGSRKRPSVSGIKNNDVTPSSDPASQQNLTTADTLLEGESGGMNKMSRAFMNRGPLDPGRGSGNLSMLTVAKSNEYSIQAAPDRNAVTLRSTLTAVIAGHSHFTKLLDAMYVLEERLPPDTKDMLIKYLSKPENMTALIDNLTVVVPVVSEDEGVLGPGGERATFRYSYVCSMLLSNGPIQLRRSLFLSPKHLDRLVSVLGHGTPTEPVVVRSVCKVLLSVLRDSPEDTVRAMVRRSDFLDALLSHISVTGCPEVCLSMLSTVRCQAELKFGPPNKPIVGVMADANLLQTLCAKLSAAALTDPVDSAASAAIENCSRVIVGIALRALVIPRFEINDDESDSEYMTKFNRDLASLDVFHQPEPILRLLDSGFEALNCHDERGYALSTALTAVRYLMVTAINGQDSSLSTIRMQLLSVNVNAYEAGIRQRIPRLALVLKSARKGCHVQTMWKRVDSPLGVVRLKILELIVVLLQHGGHETAQSMVDARIPRILMQLFARLELNSLLQHFVATIVENSFRIASPALRHAFLIDINLIDGVMQLWAESKTRESSRETTPVNNLGELSRMSNTIREYLVNTSSTEVQRMSLHLGRERLDLFARFCKGPIAEHDAQNGQLLGGVDRLPHRLDEDNDFNDGAGSIFFRPRSGGPTVD